ncbi:hypothetical protein L218DRAFT_935238 [Marasmius fiardii PR-910]|nr:hypothetical protein L218DRAFT_935238 [Marasmius fiardii PR-910]
MLHMQQPTCHNIRIRSTNDAHKIFYAVQRGVLRMITRRLDADERLALTSGHVYAWEERGPHTEITGLGIERFTEGRRWSPSRVRDEFLFYYEKYSPEPGSSSTTSEKQHPPRDWDPLVKQTYSVWVDTGKGRRKWHLTAYFTQATVDQLGTVDDIQGVGSLNVPEGYFKSTRVKKGGSKADELTSPPSNDSAPRKPFTSFPDGTSGIPHKNSHSSQNVQMYQPYPSYNAYSEQPRSSSQPMSGSRFPQLTPVITSVPSNYPPDPESPQQSPLHLAIPPASSTMYSQPHSASPVISEISNAHSLYNATRSSPIHTSPHSPHNPPWYPDYSQKPPSDVFDHGNHHPLRHYHSNSLKAEEPPLSPYGLNEPPYLSLNYHAPSPVRPIPSSTLTATPYAHTGIPSNTMTEPGSSYGASSPVETPHSIYPPIQQQTADVGYPSRPSTGCFRGHSMPVSCTEVSSASPSSSASGSVYSMTDNGGIHHHGNYEDNSSYDREAEFGFDRGLAPLGVLKRPHPYRRHPGDDKTLKLLARRNASSELEA